MEHASPSPSINGENWERSSAPTEESPNGTNLNEKAILLQHIQHCFSMMMGMSVANESPWSTLPTQIHIPSRQLYKSEGICTTLNNPTSALSVLGSRIEELAVLQKQLASELCNTRDEFGVRELEHNVLKANNEYLQCESVKYTAQIKTMIFTLRNSIARELSSLREFKSGICTEVDLDLESAKKVSLGVLAKKLNSNTVGVETDRTRQDTLIHGVLSCLVPILKSLKELKTDLQKLASVQRQDNLNALYFLEDVDKENSMMMARLMNLVHRMRELKIFITPDVFPSINFIPILLAKIRDKLSMLYRGLLSKMAILLREREQIRRETQELNVELAKGKASLLKMDESLQNYVQENTSLIIENARLRMEMQNSRTKAEAELGELHAKNRELQSHLDHAERQLADIPPVKRARTQQETLKSKRLLVEPIPCELAEIQNLRLDSNVTVSRELKIPQRAVIVVFSGIRDPSLKIDLEALHAKVHSGEPFDDHVLHSLDIYNF
jgi:hypothetical protein